jgi:hypothetical protein
MIEALQRKAAKVKVRRHAAGLSRSFQQRDVVPIANCLVGSRKTHRACPYDNYLRQKMYRVRPRRYLP